MILVQFLIRLLHINILSCVLQTYITSRTSLSSSSGSAPPTPSSVSASAPAFYPAAETVESVVESALDDLNLDDFDVTELEKELNHASPGSTSLGDSLTSLSIATIGSAPVTIPGSCSPHSFAPQSPTSPLGHFSSSFGSAASHKVLYAQMNF